MSSEAEKRQRNRERSTEELQRLHGERGPLPVRLIEEELDARGERYDHDDERRGPSNLSEHHW